MKTAQKQEKMSQVVAGEVKGREMFGHAIAGFGQNLIFGLWSSYMMVFYTDIFGISAGAASIIMLITRIWDGINDPMMGTIETIQKQNGDVTDHGFCLWLRLLLSFWY